MERVLVIKTAMDSVMHRLLNDLLLTESEIHCLTQSSAVIRYSELYPDVDIIDAKQEVFNERIPILDELKKTKWDTIYIPSSSPYFRNYDNIFFLLDELNYRKGVLYDCYGKQKVIKKDNPFICFLEYIVSCSLYKFFSAIYKVKCRMET